MQRLQRSRQNSSRRTSPDRTLTQQDQLQTIKLDKSRYTEVTISTLDEDVPFIALYKPNIQRHKVKLQAAFKINHSLTTLYQLRTIHSLNKLLALGPKEKLTNLRVLYLSSRIEKAMVRRKQKGWEAMILNKTKKKGMGVGAKIMSRVQSSIMVRNLKQGLVQLRRHRLLMKIRQISDSNEQALELENLRTQLFRLNEENFSQQIIASTRQLQKNTSYQSLLSSLQEVHYPELLTKEIKRFEAIRFKSSPRLKELLNNEVVLALTANIISAYQATSKNYENYCAQLQNQLEGYKDTEGINELREVIRQKERIIRDTQSLVGEISRMDIELKKFTPENRFNVEKVSSTLKAQDKRLQSKTKNIQETSNKIAASRTYLSTVMSTLIKRTEEAQQRQQQAQFQLRNQERTKDDELREYRRQLENVKAELEQQRLKISLLKDKKDTLRALEQLRRKWKGNQDLKILVEYLLGLHNKIQQLQRSQKKATEEQSNVAEGINFIRNYISSGIQKIEEELPVPKLEKRKSYGEGLNQVLLAIEKTLEMASKSNRQTKERLEKSLIFQSNVKSMKRPGFSDIQLDQHENLIAQRLFSQIKSSEKDFQKYNEASSSFIIKKIDQQTAVVIKQLKNTISQLQKHLSGSTQEEKQAIIAALAKIEELIKIINDSERTINQLSSHNQLLSTQLEQLKENYQIQISLLEKQIAENNRLIKQLSFKAGSSKSKEQQAITPLSKNNEQLLEKQIDMQQELIRLKSQHQESLVHHRQELIKWKEENTGLWQKIVSLEGELRAGHTQQIKEIGYDIQPIARELPGLGEKAILEEMRSRFVELERKMLDIRSNSTRDNESNRADELLRLLHQSQAKVSQLSIRNNQISARLQQTREQYQQHIINLQNELAKKTSIIKQEQINLFTSDKQRHQDNLHDRNFQLQQEIIKLKTQYENSYREEINELKKYKEESLLLRSKVNEVQSLLSRKNKDLERVESRLKQTEGNLAAEREKVSALRLEVSNLERELGRSHSETDKLALQARQQVRKITMVIRSLQDELDKKVKECELVQQETNQKSRTITHLQRESRSYQAQLKEIMQNYSQLQQKNQVLTTELTHLKAEFFSIQVQIQSDRNSKTNTHQKLLSLQNQIKGKQQTITNILSHSKAASDNLNQQLFEAREELLAKERHFQQQISVKNALINRLQHKIIEVENCLRITEQKCLALEHNTQKRDNELSPNSRDRQIQLLHQQIASLQSFLGDLSHEYKQLQAKYHQEKHRFGRFYDNAQRERSMEEIDKAIHDLADSSEFSEEVKSLIVNNEKLQIDLQQLEEERRKLLQKARAQPERQYVVELLFNIILGATKLSPQSQKGNTIWNQLVQINQSCTEVGELFTQLQKFSLRLLSLGS